MGLVFKRQSKTHPEAGYALALVIWYIVIMPCYYALALAAYLGPLVCACFMLGATAEGLSNAERHSIGAAAVAVLFALSARTLAQEVRQLRDTGSLLDHLADVWDLLDIFTVVLCVTVAMSAMTRQDPSWPTQLAVVNTMLLWFRVVQLLSGFDVTAKYVSMFFAVTQDMSSFLVMIMIFIIGNGFALMLLFPTYLVTPMASQWVPTDPTAVRLNVDTLPRAMYTSFNMMMGGFDAEALNDLCVHLGRQHCHAEPAHCADGREL
jgi:hypothetical protein